MPRVNTGPGKGHLKYLLLLATTLQGMSVQYILPELFQKNVVWALGIDRCLIKVGKKGGLGSPGD